MKKHIIVAYTDGSSLGNPGPGGWGAVVSFSNKTILEIGSREEESTNNRMELTAVLESLRAIKTEKADVEIYTDSSYVKNGITNWVKSWQKNDWKTKAKQLVLNRDLWQQLVKEESRRKRYGGVVWNHIEGHVGHPGNERADEIATSYAKEEKVELYNGSKCGYGIDLEVKVADKKLVKKKRVLKARSRAKAYSYLSLIGGVLKKHKTWGACEARVKGKPAKFKKSLSKEDEKKIIKEWGVSK